MSKHVPVIAAVIERGGRYLLGKRSPSKRSGAGYWCPVSGRIEEGETESQAVAREVREEVGLEVEAVRKLGSFETRDKSAMIHWWLTRILGGEASLQNDEHTELRWLTLQELRVLQPVFEEDLEIFEKLESERV